MSGLPHTYKATIATSAAAKSLARITVPAHTKCYARVTLALEHSASTAPFVDIELREGMSGGTLAATSSVKRNSLDTETPRVTVGTMSGAVPTGGTVRAGSTVGPQGTRELRPLLISGGTAGTTVDVYTTPNAATDIAGRLIIEIDE